MGSGPFMHIYPLLLHFHIADKTQRQICQRACGEKTWNDMYWIVKHLLFILSISMWSLFAKLGKRSCVWFMHVSFCFFLLWLHVLLIYIWVPSSTWFKGCSASIKNKNNKSLFLFLFLNYNPWRLCICDTLVTFTDQKTGHVIDQLQKHIYT